MMPRLLLALCFTFGSDALAGSEKPASKEVVGTAPVHPMYLGSLNFGIKTNDAYTDGNFSIVAPVWSSLGADATLSGDLFYLEPYISWGEQGEVASSLGFGWRHLFGNQPLTALTRHDGHQASFFEEGVAVGANLFVDMLDTETNHQFWQLGVGAEVLTRYVEVHGNYYIPLTDKKEVGTFRTRETFQSTSYDSTVTGTEPYATGNSILQPYSQTLRATTSTTTIERLFRRYEEGMEGWDIEVAFLIPRLDRWMDAQIIVGYYAFDNQPFGPQAGGEGNVEGWKLGLEIRPVPALVLNSTWYEDERLTGADWTVSLRLEIPFEGDDLGDGMSLWERIGDSFKPRRRHLMERMAEPVRRQNAAVKLAHSTDEDEGEMQATVRRVTRVVSHTQGQLVLADDIVFVNNGPAVGNGIQAGGAGGDGTAEHPVLTIQDGAAIAGPNSTASGRLWSVYSQGVTTSYTGDVTASGSTNFIGSGMRIVGISGRNFGRGPAPTLVGGIEAFGVGTLNVNGYVITTGLSTSGDGVHAEEVAHVGVLNSSFHDVVDESIDILATGGTVTSFLASGNFINRSGDNGIGMDAEGSAVIYATIAGNRFLQSADDDVQGNSFGDSRFILVATNNIHTAGNDDGYDIYSADNSTFRFTAINNRLTNLAEEGFILVSDHDSTFTALVSHNVITDSIAGSGVLAEANDDSTMNITVSSNTIARLSNPVDGGAGIDVSTFFGDNAVLNAVITGNNISGTWGPGIAAGNLSNFSMMDIRIIGNTISNVLDFDGILIESGEGTTTTGTIAGNVIRGTEDYGIHVDGFEDSTTTLAINYNNTAFNGDAGIGLHAFDNASLTITSLTGNVINTTSFHGLDVYTDVSTASIDVSRFNGNSIKNATGNGINLESATGSLLLFNGTTNNSVGPQGALRLDSVNNPLGSFILNGATITLPADVP